MSSSLPRHRLLGYRFKPSDEQLCQLLERKVRGLELPHDNVTEMDVYSRKPWLLGDHGKVNWCGEGYYFVKRKAKSELENGVRPKRGVGGEAVDGGGWWKAAVAEKPIKVKDRVVGYRSQLKFMEYKNNQQNKREDCISSTWIMHEYKLPVKDKFQKWVLCRVKDKSKKPEEANSDIKKQIQGLLGKLENQGGDHHQTESLKPP